MKTWIIGSLLVMGLGAGLAAQTVNASDYYFVYTISYSHIAQQQYTNVEYRLSADGQLARKSGKDATTEAKTVQLSSTQIAALYGYTAPSDRFEYALCRALSPVYVNLEGQQNGLHFRHQYAPCRTVYLPPAYQKLQQMLDEYLQY